MATSKEYLNFILEQLSDLERMPEAGMELPYEGAKPMAWVDEVDNKAFLTELFLAVYDQLPQPKKKK